MELEEGNDVDKDIVIDEGDVNRVIDNYIRGLETPSAEEEEEESGMYSLLMNISFCALLFK